MKSLIKKLINNHVRDPELKSLLISNPDLGELLQSVDRQFENYEEQLQRYQQRLKTSTEQHSEIPLNNGEIKSLSFQAYHDSLTRLPNRNYLFERTDATILQAHRNSTPFALLFIDLDGFKFVNDNYGHDYGDELLKAVAERLRQFIRETDVVARLAGDEFCILLMNLDDPAQSARVARGIFHQFKDPIRLESFAFQINMSIGISHFPEDGHTTKQLMKNADIAMYEAKKRGHNQIQFYEKRLTEKVEQRLEFETDLSHALENNQLRLSIEPHIRISDGQLPAATITTIWQHPIRGDIKSEMFYQLTSNSQTLMPILSWEIEQCCHLLKVWQLRSLRQPTLRVFVDSRQFFHKEFFKVLADGIVEIEQLEHRIELVICETVLRQDPQKVKQILVQCKKQGFKTTISFRGQGFLPIEFLESSQVDGIELKHDESVANITEDNDELISGIHSLTDAIDLELHIRGVSDRETKIFYAKNGCEILSGNYFTEPLDTDQFESVLKRFKAADTDSPVKEESSPEDAQSITDLKFKRASHN